MNIDHSRKNKVIVQVNLRRQVFFFSSTIPPSQLLRVLEFSFLENSLEDYFSKLKFISQNESNIDSLNIVYRSILLKF